MNKNGILCLLIVLILITIMILCYPMAKEKMSTWIQDASPSLNIEMLNVK